MDFPNDEFRRADNSQLSHFDQEMTEFRQVYESLTAGERRDLREWLEAVDALGHKCPFDWCLRVKVEHDEFDENDDKVDERNAEFVAWTMLEAIKCWDEGKPFVPDTVYP
jgi:hypothetical protein